MSTITGLRVSELQSLALGSTGTLFYAASASTNSYKMSERDLYATLYRYHLSGAFQPKDEDWRFVHKTGSETITGEKTFVNNIILTNLASLQVEDFMIDPLGNLVSNLNDNFISLQSGTIGQYGASPEVSIHINNRTLSGNWNAQKFSPTGIYSNSNNNHINLRDSTYTILSGDFKIGGGNNSLKIHKGIELSYGGNSLVVASDYIGTSENFISFIDKKIYAFEGPDIIDWGNYQLKTGNINGSASTLNWSGKTLYGNWTAEQLQGAKLILSGNAPSTPTSAGISGQIAMSGQKLFIATGTNQWGYVNITPWI